MKLTVALGLHYDNQAGSHVPVQLSENRQKSQLTAVDGAIIDVLPEAEINRMVEYSSRYELFYLTYNLRGLPDPMRSDQAKVNVYV